MGPLEELIEKLEGMFEDYTNSFVGRDVAKLSLDFLFNPEKGHWYRLKNLVDVHEHPEINAEIITNLGKGVRIFGIKRLNSVSGERRLEIKYNGCKTGWIKLSKTNMGKETIFQISDEPEPYWGNRWKLDATNAFSENDVETCCESFSN